jgi:hypothetical protein
MIIAFLFCKFPDVYSRIDGFWGLINPEQTDFVSREAIATFLEKLQTICIIIPLKKELSQQDKNNEMITYLKKLSNVQQEALTETLQAISNVSKPHIRSNRELGIVEVSKQKVL